MSLKPTEIPPVPEGTVRIARAAFPKGNPYLRLRDELGALYEDADFAGLFPKRGQHGLPPWRLALITVMQFLENLSDRQAADAVRARIDWKYALSLDLSDPGFDFSVLSEFRNRLLAQGGEPILLDRMLRRLQERGLVKARAQQRTDSTHMLASIRALNRLELIVETLRAALNALSSAAPEWVKSVAPPQWYERYELRAEEARLPKGKAARRAYAEAAGVDGFILLSAVDAQNAPTGLRDILAVEVLRRVWERHFECTPLETGPPEGRVRLRPDGDFPPASEGLESPYDPEARYRSKHETHWTGYMVHVSETCERDQVHLITNVDTTVATVHEAMRTAAIHQALHEKGLAPSEHLVDAAYVSAQLLVSATTEHGIRIVGPPRPKTTWQARTEGAYTVDDFTVDWQARTAVCPQGKQSIGWSEGTRQSGEAYVAARFSAEDCNACPARSLCTRSKQSRQLFLKAQEQYEALQRMREQITSEEGRQLYRRRAGIEATLAQGIRTCGLRQARYRGVKKAHLQAVATAAAINVARLDGWWQGRPHAPTRVSRFARLAA